MSHHNAPDPSASPPIPPPPRIRSKRNVYPPSHTLDHILRQKLRIIQNNRPAVLASHVVKRHALPEIPLVKIPDIRPEDVGPLKPAPLMNPKFVQP